MKYLGPRVIIFAVAGLLLLLAIPIAAQTTKKMPPSFAFENEPSEVLKNYPLGSINKQDAFSHHGGPIREVVLPNGNEGWIYKSGEKAGVPSIYVLEFSQDGVVIDVLHKDHRYKIGHSALQYQYLVDKDPMVKTLGPNPDQ